MRRARLRSTRRPPQTNQSRSTEIYPNEIETDEFEAATSYLNQLWTGGAFHPDAASLPALRGESMFKSGQLGFLVASLIPLYGVMRTGLIASDPQADAAPLLPPGHDGGDPVTYQGPGFAGFTAIPAKVGQDTARLEELLRVMDYWCAPFGSEEYTFVNYGIEGRHSPSTPRDHRFRRLVGWPTPKSSGRTTCPSPVRPSCSSLAIMAKARWPRRRWRRRCRSR